MADDKKRPSGAPESDLTSALFVSARKKQLEQQEAERRAREKAESLAAAEEEARRLERDVEERRRRAQEESERTDAEIRRAQAERANAEKRAASAPAGAPWEASGGAAAPGAAAAPKAKGKLSGKTIGIAAGAVAAVAAAAVCFLVLGGGGAPYITAGGADVRGIYWSAQSGAVTFNFLEDGTFEHEDGSSGTKRGKYSIKGETVTAEAGGETFTLTAQGSEILVDSQGATYTRSIPEEPKSAEPAAPSWRLDPEAKIDQVVRIEQMKMGFTFPGSQLKPLEKSEESTSLSSMDGLGVFTVSALKAYGTARIAEKDLVSYRDTLESAMNKNTPGGLNVIERDQKTDPLQYYFKATYKSEDGAERYFFAGISGWVNAKDKTHHLYAVVLDCPESQAAVYQRLYDRLFASCIDI